ncbi:dihydrofolate reductase family protein [Pinibacter aurantiacus]|uniref:Dihydrofolate reductase family protein n=1 Tax=Pinibacter aurantiacus TaxID=2851599 RepID=A0A9E2SFD3_9BACT|nr:dihydrofolate reductase family protein [Pinibacter aurantiacus]MBV4360269.1 dihydrofolate reductase family protein [Pinibacter aurantiacus]
MGKTIATITMSLDGYIAGPDVAENNPMGTNGEALHKWLFEGSQKEDKEIMQDLVSNSGAVITGGRTYQIAIDGAWGSNSPFEAHAFVVSSKLLKVREGFTLVNDGIESALAKAKKTAKEKDVWIMGGANVIQQYLNAGLVDEFHLSIAPILLNSGTSLFITNENRISNFEKIRAVNTKHATHLFLKPIMHNA